MLSFSCAVRDESVALKWKPVSRKDLAYNVYRSADPRAPATVYSLIARTGKPEYTDSGLNLGTRYYYRVAAVNAANAEGPVSEQLEARTSLDNTQPPRPIKELGIVRRSESELVLYWQKSPEPDVARYIIFRGDSPNFQIGGRDPYVELEAPDYFLQVYRDQELDLGKTYCYKVQPIDWADNKQTDSLITFATTPGGI